MTWNHKVRAGFGVANSISKVIQDAEFNRGKPFVSPCSHNDLLIASDYGGEHKAATHTAFSFLVVDPVYVWLYLDEVKRIRNDILGNERTMQFKSLNDGVRQKALPHYLTAANTLPGILFVFVIRKGLVLAEDDVVIDNAHSEWLTRIAQWNPKTLRKFLTVGNLGALIIASLSKPGQSVTWLTDDDELTANEQRVKDSTDALSHLYSHYGNHNLNNFRFGSSRWTDYLKQSEDLISVADLTAGAFSECANLKRVDLDSPLMERDSLGSQGASVKSQYLMGWFCNESFASLNRVSIVIESSKKDGAVVTQAELKTDIHHFAFNPTDLYVRYSSVQFPQTPWPEE